MITETNESTKEITINGTKIVVPFRANPDTFAPEVFINGGWAPLELINNSTKPGTKQILLG
jgi:hypothetical protein